MPVRAACRVVLPGGSDGVATVWIRRLLRTDVAELPLISVDPIVCGISIPIDGGASLGVLAPPVGEVLIKPASVKGTCATYPRLDGTRMIPRLGRGGALALVRHLQPPFISRLAVSGRRHPCFHLLACPRACGVWLPRRRREGRNALACEWCSDCPCRLAPCPSTERSAGSPRRSREVGWCARGWFLCCLPLLGKQAARRLSLHPAPSNGRRRTAEHPPRSTEPSSVAWPAGTCSALGPSARRGRGLTSRSREKPRYNV